MEKSAMSLEAPQRLTRLSVKGVNASVVSGDENFANSDYRLNACPDSLVDEVANPSETERRTQLRSHETCPLKIAPQSHPITNPETVKAENERQKI